MFAIKAFAYVGSRRKESFTAAFTNKLLCVLKDKMDIDTELCTASSVKIKECLGCTDCFTKGSCILIDDMEQLKATMLSSDIIIFGSPVYLWQVSGNMKNFIDRITYWTHTFRLIGKVGIVITMSGNNGNQTTGDYLKLVLENLGMSVINNIALHYSDLKNQAAYDSIVEVEAKKIINSIVSCNFPLSTTQELFFQTMKADIQNQFDGMSEKKYWYENRLVNEEDFRTLYYKRSIFHRNYNELSK